ncbi:hypothetical protein HBI88_196240 [Parastagonospora nodorum]|nr:hypothetical protein HBI75_143960 [Parastagonospora nodorum]KAH5188614.1 hypothetical protein HBH68_159250 [Parastagonospora nodorum]KAH5250121.1 hypothetical protein HBI72_156990 [Parastagonospora nodorum]KAH5447597.1 hypothetical protein HBI30_177390 [Parastagonospora nodorum]KAH5536293.1 hypothetical protein HBI27_159730 [Parastagonospora nodorum]
MDYRYLHPAEMRDATPDLRHAPSIACGLFDRLGHTIDAIRGPLKQPSESPGNSLHESREHSDAEAKPRKRSQKLPADEATLQQGIPASEENESMKGGFITVKLRELRDIYDSAAPLQLRDYQIHAVNQILRILLDRGKSALLAYSIGLRKTIIVIDIYVRRT